MDCQPLKYRDPFKKLTKGGCQPPSPTPSGCWWENFLKKKTRITTRKKNKPSARATSGPQHSRSLCVCMWANDTAAKVSFVSINYNTPSLCSFFFSTTFSSSQLPVYGNPNQGWLSAAPGNGESGSIIRASYKWRSWCERDVTSFEFRHSSDVRTFLLGRNFNTFSRRQKKTPSQASPTLGAVVNYNFVTFHQTPCGTAYYAKRAAFRATVYCLAVLAFGANKMENFRFHFLLHGTASKTQRPSSPWRLWWVVV